MVDMISRDDPGWHSVNGFKGIREGYNLSRNIVRFLNVAGEQNRRDHLIRCSLKGQQQRQAASTMATAVQMSEDLCLDHLHSRTFKDE